MGYAGMSAMYIQESGLGVRSLYGSQGDAAHKGAALPDWDKRQREPVHPFAPKFLRTLTTSKTKTLMTTRLFPAPLEDIVGVKHEWLAGLSRTDAVRFLRSEGVAGARAELERAGEIHDFHPLMLKQLSAAIQRTRLKDISAAFREKIIDPQEPQMILQKSYSLLNAEEKQVATTVSVLRSAFSFDTARALFPKMNEDRLWQILCGLQQLGFLFYDAEKQQFDFHPILRSFLYDNLTAKDKVHQQAVSYFEALPKAEKVVQLEDLAPVIELYHHLIGAGKFDEAIDLLDKRLSYPIYFQLSNYNLFTELLRELFPDGEDQPPRLKNESAQAWTLNSLANSYSLSGQPAKAVPLFLMQNKLQEKDNDKNNLAIGLGNVASMAQIQIGQLSAAGVHLRKRIALCQEIKDEFNEAIGHQELGRVLAYQGRFGGSSFPKAMSFRKANADATAEDELAKSTASWKKINDYQGLSMVYFNRSLSALMQVRVGQVGNLSYVGQIGNLPYSEAHQALEFAEKDAQTDYPTPRDFIRAYWLLGESLIQCSEQNEKIKKPLEIHFYDEPFQTIVGTEVVQPGNELAVAERCLTEALRRCRKVNLVEMEADILLAWARLKWVIGKLGNQVIGELGEIEEHLKEAKEIAERAGFRLQLADIHLFCAEVLLDIDSRPQRSQRSLRSLLGLTAREHLQLAKEYAKDVSRFEDLYQSRDKHFYDTTDAIAPSDGISSIPEFEMLKRGMTEQKRIENGYYVAYQIAEALEKKIK
jgi:tetratricopeptide (TPR) repeat protein